jgi:hypothetical protein
MARGFNGSTQYAVNSTPVFTAYPFTVAAWFYTNSTANQTIFQIADTTTAATGARWSLDLRSTGDLRFSSRTSAGAQTDADSAINYSTGTWQHGVMVGRSATDRSVYLDGGNEGTNTTSNTPDVHDETSIGRLNRGDPPTFYFDGYIAEVGVWGVALSAREVQSLAAGFSAALIRPQSRIAYWPFIRDDRDLTGGYDLTAFNSPTFEPHARMYYPAPPIVGLGSVAVGGGATSGVLDSAIFNSGIFGHMVR